MEKYCGDATETVLGCTNILKNAVGIVGIVIIIGICIIPILKLLSLMTVYYLASAVSEPIADNKIVELLSQMGNTFKLFLAIISSLAIMLIIGITIVIKISGTG